MNKALERHINEIQELNPKFANYSIIGLTPSWGGEDAPLSFRRITYTCEKCNDGKLRTIHISLAKRGAGCKRCEKNHSD